MLVFVVACGAPSDIARRIGDAVGRVADAIPNLDRNGVVTRASESGMTAVATVSHSSEVAAPRRYVVDTFDEMLLFDGLPVRPDGRLTLDAEHLRGVSELDGAGMGLRVSFALDRIELLTGVLGMSACFVASPPGGGHVVSNSVDALRWLLNLREPDPLGLSSFLTLGWTVSDRTLTAGVRMLPGGSRVRIDRGGIHVEESFGRRAIESQLARADPPQPRLLAEQMTETVSGLSVFGPNVECALTAGRDSRLCLALLRAADVDAAYYTFGTPGDPDVDVAVELARRFGLVHEVLPARSLTDADGEHLSRTFVLQNDGLRSFEQIADQVAAETRIDSLGVKLSGVGGEIARIGTVPLNALATNVRPLADTVAFQRRALGSKLDPSEGFVTHKAVAVARGYVDSFVAARRTDGLQTRKAGESFYLVERMGRWAATGVRQSAPSADLFTPFFDRRFIRAALAGSGGRQFAESLHYELLTALGSDLRDAPFQKPWPRQTARFAGLRSIAMTGRVFSGRLRQSGSGSGVFRSTPGSSARDWVSATAQVHLAVVERADASSLGEFIDLAALRRALETRTRLGRGGLRALTAVWWFDAASDGA